MRDGSQVQLSLLREISVALLTARIPWWLFGGWAMDFHAGRVTRDHPDVEIFIWKKDAAKAHELLAGLGYLAPLPLHPDECHVFLKDGAEIGFYFLVEKDQTVSISGRWQDWHWPKTVLDGHPLHLGGVDACAMSIEGLITMKTEFPLQPHGKELREKDLADIVLLRKLAKRGVG